MLPLNRFQALGFRGRGQDMTRAIKRRGLKTPARGAEVQTAPKSTASPIQVVSDRLSVAMFANRLLKSEAARQRAMTADILFGLSEPNAY